MTPAPRRLRTKGCPRKVEDLYSAAAAGSIKMTPAQIAEEHRIAREGKAK